MFFLHLIVLVHCLQFQRRKFISSSGLHDLMVEGNPWCEVWKGVQQFLGVFLSGSIKENSDSK